ncbi:MAG: crotonase/enoyl-CoA hydratase family protein [Nocardia sp.]|nr:crotonase/enoyl-CoA hydratase family protein [Nocardia sp.]
MTAERARRTGRNERPAPAPAGTPESTTETTARTGPRPAHRPARSPEPTRSGIVSGDRSTVARGVTVTAPVRVERTGDVVVWTIDNPEQRNPISDEATIEALESAVHAADRDHSIRVAILTGAGTAFSAGGNVKHMRDKAGMFAGTPAQLRQGYRHGIQRIPKALYHCEIPTIAAVNGPAIGAGCDLALMCDMRIAATTATFAESFVRLGLIPGDGGAWLLPRAVGMARASQLAFTGAAIDAATALEWGMVNEVVEPDRLLDTAHRLAAEIAVNPPHALRMTKRLLREGQQQSLETLLELSAAMQAVTHHTADHDEAVAAVLERRAPRFTGD